MYIFINDDYKQGGAVEFTFSNHSITYFEAAYLSRTVKFTFCSKIQLLKVSPAWAHFNLCLEFHIQFHSSFHFPFHNLGNLTKERGNRNESHSIIIFTLSLMKFGHLPTVSQLLTL